MDFFRFDVILTSETIYSKTSQKKLLELMKCALKPDGVMYPFIYLFIYFKKLFLMQY